MGRGAARREARVRIGHGFDVHALVEGRDLYLGGVFVPHERGLAGHSDGDVLLHAVASALFGALGEGDLGTHFPSSDPELRGISSRRILDDAVEKVKQGGREIGNVDTTVIAQEPRLASHREMMSSSLADVLGIPVERVNVKITSTDRLGAVGRAEGIAAHAVVLLCRPGEAE
jgi:2-C-methyl-D-erythritol 2,4-cyclodiphosphate synthase